MARASAPRLTISRRPRRYAPISVFACEPSTSRPSTGTGYSSRSSPRPPPGGRPTLTCGATRRSSSASCSDMPTTSGSPGSPPGTTPGSSSAGAGTACSRGGTGRRTSRTSSTGSARTRSPGPSFPSASGPSRRSARWPRRPPCRITRGRTAPGSASSASGRSASFSPGGSRRRRDRSRRWTESGSGRMADSPTTPSDSGAGSGSEAAAGEAASRGTSPGRTWGATSSSSPRARPTPASRPGSSPREARAGSRESLPGFPLDCEAVTRYRGTGSTSRVTPFGTARLRVELDPPQWGVAPGQSVVLYAGEECLGGAIIEETAPAG